MSTIVKPNKDIKIEYHYMTKNPCYQAGKKITPTGITWHSVGTPQNNVDVFIKGWDSSSHTNSAVHAFINDERVVICLPVMGTEKGYSPGKVMRSWHSGTGPSGKSANNTNISFECCESNLIKYTGGSNFIYDASNKKKIIDFFQKCFSNAAEFCARMSVIHNIDCSTVWGLCSHKEGHDSPRLDHSGHGDINHILNKFPELGTMDDLRKIVVQRAKEIKEEQELEEFIMSLNKQEVFNQYMDNYLASLAKKSPSTWAKDDITWATNNKIIADPKKPEAQRLISREECLAFIHRAFSNILNK